MLCVYEQGCLRDFDRRLILCPGKLMGSQRCPSLTALLSEAVNDDAGTMACNYCVWIPYVLDFLSVEREWSRGEDFNHLLCYISFWYRWPESNGKHEVMPTAGSCTQMFICLTAILLFAKRVQVIFMARIIQL